MNIPDYETCLKTQIEGIELSLAVEVLPVDSDLSAYTENDIIHIPLSADDFNCVKGKLSKNEFSKSK